mgnify:CR=1 FL=1
MKIILKCSLLLSTGKFYPGLDSVKVSDIGLLCGSDCVAEKRECGSGKMHVPVYTGIKLMTNCHFCFGLTC